MSFHKVYRALVASFGEGLRVFIFCATFQIGSGETYRFELLEIFFEEQERLVG